MKYDRTMRVEIGSKVYNGIMQKVEQGEKIMVDGVEHDLVDANRIERTNMVILKLKSRAIKG